MRNWFHEVMPVPLSVAAACLAVAITSPLAAGLPSSPATSSSAITLPSPPGPGCQLIDGCAKKDPVMWGP